MKGESLRTRASSSITFRFSHGAKAGNHVKACTWSDVFVAYIISVKLRNTTIVCINREVNNCLTGREYIFTACTSKYSILYWYYVYIVPDCLIIVHKSLVGIYNSRNTIAIISSTWPLLHLFNYRMCCDNPFHLLCIQKLLRSLKCGKIINKVYKHAVRNVRLWHSSCRLSWSISSYLYGGHFTFKHFVIFKTSRNYHLNVWKRAVSCSYCSSKQRLICVKHIEHESK